MTRIGRRLILITVFGTVIATGVALFLPRSKQIMAASQNLILVSIDTVRADYLELFNRNGAPTPGLNRIAKNGFVFTNTISQVPLTLPSHCTMLTGTYPMLHLVQENATGRLGNGLLTLAEVLKANGYSTAAFLGSFVMASNTGLNQGFDVYDDAFALSALKFDLGSAQKSATEVYNSFRLWFDKRPPGKFFAFLHFYDPHAPYEPPESFKPEISSDEMLYKGELRYVDSVVGQLFDAMEHSGIRENTVLLVTGDHGEMLGEHDEKGHGYFLYQQALKVPLIIALPHKNGGVRIDVPVEIVDLMPTVLDLLGIPIPETVQGESFKPLLERTRAPAGYAFSESLTGSQVFGTTPLRSVQDAAFKYIESPNPELYDIRSDEFEQRNLYQQKKALAEEMKMELQNIVSRSSATAGTAPEIRNVSPDEEERLAALGYISGRSSSNSAASRDPKEYIRHWMTVNEAIDLLNQGKYADCLGLIQNMRREISLPPLVKVFEARAYAETGNFQQAFTVLEEIFQGDPTSLPALLALADVHEKAGKIGSALEVYGKLLEQQDSVFVLKKYAFLMLQMKKKEELLSYLVQREISGNYSAGYDEVLGEIYLAAGEYEKAKSFLTKSIERNPDFYRPYVLLAGALDSQGDTGSALALLDAVRERFHQADFLLELGILYHKTGNLAGEIETLERMIQLHENDPRGYFYLAKAVLDQGADLDKVVQLARTGLDLNPNRELQIFGNDLLAEAYSRLGMHERAAQHFSAARRLEPLIAQ